VTCKETLTSHRELLDELTDALIEKETIDYTELYQSAYSSLSPLTPHLLTPHLYHGPTA
jgi:ATP-dependent Zn protease